MRRPLINTRSSVKVTGRVPRFARTERGEKRGENSSVPPRTDRRRSPPLTPTLGCSLADRMTSTMPMMNHSLRTAARSPMLQTPGFSGSPPAGPRPHDSASSRELRETWDTASGATSGHVIHREAVKTGRAARRDYEHRCFVSDK